MRRLTFMQPQGVLTAEVVRDVLSLVEERPINLEALERCSNNELLMLYDWAMREHLAASDNHQTRRRVRPWLVGWCLLPGKQEEIDAHLSAASKLKAQMFEPWEDPTCGGCQLAMEMRNGGQAGAGCADHEKPYTPRDV